MQAGLREANQPVKPEQETGPSGLATSQVVETWNRCWLQPIVHATSGPHGDLSCYKWQARSIHH